LFTAALKAER